MKRLAIGLSLIILLGILAHGLPSHAQPSQVPHVNPAMARDTLESAEVMFAYSNLFTMAALRQYQDAGNMLEELRTAEIPEELQYISDRYNNLSRELFTLLNKGECLLNEASSAFSQNQPRHAQERLNEAEAAIHSARFLLDDMEVIAESLASKLGVLATPATSQLDQAYQRLERSLQLLRQLTEALDQLRQRLVENPEVKITTKFHHITLLEISAPDTVYPGRPFIIRGKVTSTNGYIDRTITVLLDDSPLTRETVTGRFHLQVTTPPDTPSGEHILTVAVTQQGHYSAAEKRQAINVSRLPIQAELQLPRLAILPQPIQINGRVHHKLHPLQDARINLTFKGLASTAMTAADGSFTGEVSTSQLRLTTATAVNPFYVTTTTRELPVDPSLFGWQAITIAIDPVEPWYSPLKITRQISTINPLNTALMLAALISLGLLTYRQVRTSQQERGSHPSQPVELPVAAPPPRLKLTGITGRVLSSYRSGVKVVERVSGITLLPHTTLREFLNATSPRLATATQPFTELTLMAELALYSPHPLDEDDASRAEQLAARVRKELPDGTS